MRVHSLSFSGEMAGVHAEKGKLMPMTSITVAIELAVKRPPQDPAPGQACYASQAGGRRRVRLVRRHPTLPSANFRALTSMMSS